MESDFQEGKGKVGGKKTLEKVEERRPGLP
jgi:hypothetical protein